MQKEMYVVFRANSKELCAYTLRGTFSGEARETAALLAYENGLDVSEIEISLEKR